MYVLVCKWLTRRWLVLPWGRTCLASMPGSFCLFRVRGWRQCVFFPEEGSCQNRELLHPCGRVLSGRVMQRGVSMAPRGLSAAWRGWMVPRGSQWRGGTLGGGIAAEDLSIFLCVVTGGSPLLCGLARLVW